MSELRERMIRDLKLAGLAESTSTEYVRAVRQLTAYHMIRPDRLTERQVEDYLLYVRDELGAARGTFAPLLAGLKFFYVNTLGYDWPLLTKKNSPATAEAFTRCPERRRLSPPDRGLEKTDLSRPVQPDLCVWPAYQ